MHSLDLAVIGGTGVYALAELADAEAVLPQTPYGAPSGPIRVGRYAGKRVAFLARHGEGHSLPPHKINYRANLAALKAVGAKTVLALNTVGGITERFGPRVLACPEQLIDYTWGRIATVCEEPGTQVLHVDFGEPYTQVLRERIAVAARTSATDVVMAGCYGATPGPRLETRAEIARMRRDGCDLVGMTGMPEAGLARELDLDYAALCIVANWAAGAGPHPDAVITLQEVLDNVEAAMTQLPRLLRALLQDAPEPA